MPAPMTRRLYHAAHFPETFGTGFSSSFGPSRQMRGAKEVPDPQWDLLARGTRSVLGPAILKLGLNDHASFVVG
jgi:hypothetical protein